MPRGCVFFDRDGIVNSSPGEGYVERREDFHILPEFVRCLRIVRARGYEAVIVTNQRGVALGLVPQAELQAMHDHLRQRLAREGLSVLDILVCPHDDKDDCSCRKPKPGLILEAARRHDLDLARSWVIGDHERDVEAGRRAGCRTIRVGPREEPSAADFRVGSVAELENFLAARLPDAAAGV